MDDGAESRMSGRGHSDAANQRTMFEKMAPFYRKSEILSQKGENPQ